MKPQLTLGLLLLLAAGLVRASEAEISQLMENYWHAYSRSDFVTAATFLDPRDTGALKAGLLPLFLRAADSKNVNVVPLVNSFFEGIPDDRREEMTEAQVFAGMNRMMRDVMPQVYAELGRTSIRAIRVTPRGDSEADIAYTIRVRGEALEEADRASLHEGRWYLRTRDAPTVTIERFRMLLGLAYETGPEVKLSPEEP